MGKKKMKTKGHKSVAFLLVLGLAILSGNLQASVEVSFRLSGSFGYLMERAGDIDEVRRGVEANIFDLNQMDRYTASIDWQKPNRINDFRAELVFSITRNIGISIGSGYILAKNQGSYSVDSNFTWIFPWNGYLYENTEHQDYSRNYTVSAIPITLDAYFILPIGKKETFKVFAHVGAGYYFGKMQHVLDLDSSFVFTETSNDILRYKQEGELDVRMTEKTNSNAWGYHGGLGLDIKLTRLLSFGAEVFGRHVEFRDWEGSQVANAKYRDKVWSLGGGERVDEDSDTDSAYGNLWTYQAGCSDEVNPYTLMWVLDEEPEGDCFQNVRKSAIDLNSYGLSVSIKLSFNLF